MSRRYSPYAYALTAHELDSIVAGSLQSLHLELSSGTWRGRREREVISLFCFGHLLQHCQTSSALYDPTQLAIEVAVPQISDQRGLSGKGGNKSQVCKDIVIWPKPRMTCWDAHGDATVRPISVIEWKHNERAVSEYDTNWLRAFSADHPEFVGYAVSTQHPAKDFAISCSRVLLGKVADRWFHFE